MPGDEIPREDHGFLPENDVFKLGTSRADCQRALVARAGFMEGLVRDRPALDRFGAWLAQVRDYAALEATGAAPSEPDFIPDAVQLVRKGLRLRWPWVVWELIVILNRMVRFQLDHPVKAVPPPRGVGVMAPVAPLLTILHVEEGDTTDEVRARLRGAERLLKAAEAASGDQGTAPREDTSYLRTWGRWYYEARVQKPPKSVRALAAERCQAEGHRKGHDCRKYVTNTALREAERLLNLSEYTF